jgi:hypothetical protein
MMWWLLDYSVWTIVLDILFTGIIIGYLGYDFVRIYIDKRINRRREV